MDSFILDKVNTLPKNSRVLEVGFGSGDLLREIRKLRPDLELIGVDVSRYAVKSVQDPSIQCLCKPYEKLQIDSVDMIISVHGIDYVPYDIAYKKVRGDLKANGTLAAVLHYSHSRFMAELEWVLEGFKHAKESGDTSHIDFKKPEEIEAWIKICELVLHNSFSDTSKIFSLLDYFGMQPVTVEEIRVKDDHRPLGFGVYAKNLDKR
jgi:SAM-dependent methyltransferase